MGMTDEEYRKLVDLTIKFRLAENDLVESLEKIKKANEVLRELLLKEGQS